ncbi:MAG: 7-cyano-7-deazaguanine synthase QueC [Myxococcota bacterium]
MKSKKKAIVLLSGGLDSTTTLALAIDRGFSPLGLSFSYGQRHSVEMEAARKITDFFKIEEQIVLDLPLAQIGGNVLTDSSAEVPHTQEETPEDDIPPTYVPARNTIFLSYALAVAEVKEITDIFIGVSSVDYSGYPDCRPPFIKSFEEMANQATKLGIQGKTVKIHAPLMQLDKAQTIKVGLDLGVDYSITHTCYDPDEQGRACGECDSCKLRLQGFARLGIEDPAVYRNKP